MQQVIHVCVLCGTVDPNSGFTPFAPSSNFTSWDLLGAGDSLCRVCEKFFRDQRYRRRSWVYSRGRVTFMKANKILPHLLKPPSPPFMVYTSKAGKKQTYLRLFRKGANQNRHQFWACDEDLGLIHVHPEKVRELYRLAKDAIVALEKKSALLNPTAKDFIHRDICERIEAVKSEPLWALIVRLI